MVTQLGVCLLEMLAVPSLTSCLAHIFVETLLPLLLIYCNDTKFSDRQVVWANSEDPDQTAPTAPRGAVFSGSSLCIIWRYHTIVVFCLNFRVFTVKVGGCPKI